MGLLDDAIREHLELQRRRGADAGEIERAEREALGPVRRMPEPGDAQAFGEPYDADESIMPDDEREFVYGGHDDLADDEYERLPPSQRVEDSDEDVDFFEPRALGPADLAGHETAEYAVEHDEWQHEAPETSAPGPQRLPHDGEEDVLEETPEFLQDTPDHDRLWFEQRPPRDFRFDS